MKRTLMGNYPRYQQLNLAKKPINYLGSVALANKDEQKKDIDRRITLIMSSYPKAIF